MTDEKRIQGNELKKKIDEAKSNLDIARRVEVRGVYGNGTSRKLPLTEEISRIIATIVISHIEKALADLTSEYEAL